MILCGLEMFKAVFIHLDSNISFNEISFKDGYNVPSGSSIIRIQGRGVALLEGERVALNILQRLCGIATLTREYVERAHPVDIFDTRKTTPGLRIFEKYAVYCGGGQNHRFGLYDAILIKDNHIKAAGGIIKAVEKVRTYKKNPVPIEVEVSSLDEVNYAIKAKSDIIMLDNMTLNDIKKAVLIINGKARIEVSGNVSLKNLDVYSKMGVDCVAV